MRVYVCVSYFPFAKTDEKPYNWPNVNLPNDFMSPVTFGICSLGTDELQS